MRFPALVFSAVVAVAGAGYFLAKPKPMTAEKYYAAKVAAPGYGGDQAADADDAATIARIIHSKDLSEEESLTLATAAGRRYMRRKLAWMEAQRKAEAGKAAPSDVEARKSDMEAARRVYDLADSLGRKTRLLMSSARADVEMERLLARGASGLSALADHHIGQNQLSDAEVDNIEKAFAKEFGRPLPVSARGASAVHRSLGFDHSGRVDVAVSPGSSEGLWLRRQLLAKGISFFAFRGSAAGQSTGAHIHIGPASGRSH